MSILWTLFPDHECDHKKIICNIPAYKFRQVIGISHICPRTLKTVLGVRIVWERCYWKPKPWVLILILLQDHSLLQAWKHFPSPQPLYTEEEGRVNCEMLSQTPFFVEAQILFIKKKLSRLQLFLFSVKIIVTGHYRPLPHNHPWLSEIFTFASDIKWN